MRKEVRVNSHSLEYGERECVLDCNIPFYCVCLSVRCGV